MNRKFLYATSLVAAASMMLTAVSPSLAAPLKQDAKTLRINLGTFPDTIDPQKSSFVNEIAHLKQIYEGLTKLDPKLQTIPGAAEKWTYSPDGLTLTFNLRKGLKYSDGSPLNAKRFEYSIIRNINPATAGEYGTITNEIAGAPEWQDAVAGKKDEATIKAAEDTVRQSVQALDSKGQPCKDYAQADCLKLQVKLSKPAPYFHTILGIWVAYPAKQELIEAGGDQWWADAKNQIGNGPYIMQDLEQGQRALFVPNPNYWGGKAKTNIEYSYITDSAVATEAYKNDEFDIVVLPPEDLASVQADPVLSKQAMIYPGACTTALQFRNFSKPFDDPKVRQAFAYALDRDRWVKDIFQGLAAPTLTWIPPGFPGYKQGEARYKYDPKAANKAIADSSYKTVEALPPIILTFSDTPRNRTRNEWLGARFKEVFGDALEVELKPVEATAFTAKQKDKNSDLQMFLGGWCADYPDQQNWLSVYFNGASTFAQRIGYDSKAFNDLTNQADKELNPAKRTQLYAQAQDALVKELPVAFFYNSANAYMVKPWVKGIKTTPQDSDWPGSTNPLTIDIVK
jgi:oligopeptide transport system substrate-binding protein